MNFEKLREEFSHVASFLKWDNSEIKNGLVKNFNEKDVNTSAIYLAMNPRGSNQEIIDIYKNNSPEEIYKKQIYKLGTLYTIFQMVLLIIRMILVF